MRPHKQQPTRLPLPWDSPGKNTGVGCHFLLQCMKVKSEREVAQLCLTLSNPMDCSLPGSSIHGIFQARVLEWGAIAFSGYSLVGCKELDTIEHTCTYLCTSLYATAYTFIHIHTCVHTDRSNDLPLNWIYLDFLHCAFWFYLIISWSSFYSWNKVEWPTTFFLMLI